MPQTIFPELFSSTGRDIEEEEWTELTKLKDCTSIGQFLVQIRPITFDSVARMVIQKCPNDQSNQSKDAIRLIALSSGLLNNFLQLLPLDEKVQNLRLILDIIITEKNLQLLHNVLYEIIDNFPYDLIEKENKILLDSVIQYNIDNKLWKNFVNYHNLGEHIEQHKYIRPDFKL